MCYRYSNTDSQFPPMQKDFVLLVECSLDLAKKSKLVRVISGIIVTGQRSSFVCIPTCVVCSACFISAMLKRKLLLKHKMLSAFYSCFHDYAPFF